MSNSIKFSLERKVWKDSSRQQKIVSKRKLRQKIKHKLTWKTQNLKMQNMLPQND